jgi:hypothetical protein
MLMKIMGTSVVDPIAISVMFAVACAVGYGVCKWQSHERRRRFGYRAEAADEAGLLHGGS